MCFRKKVTLIANIVSSLLQARTMTLFCLFFEIRLEMRFSRSDKESQVTLLRLKAFFTGSRVGTCDKNEGQNMITKILNLHLTKKRKLAKVKRHSKDFLFA